jgi:hypothetical protein
MKLGRGFKNTTRKKTALQPVTQESKTSTQPVSPGMQAVASTGMGHQTAGTETGKTPNQPVASAGSQHKSVTIQAKINVGFGNTLYLRGEGRGLSWNQGIPLTCVDNSTWQWSGEADDKLKFKLLLNDSVWSKGEDLLVAPGERLEVSPAF